jgi:hypothetical protein
VNEQEQIDSVRRMFVNRLSATPETLAAVNRAVRDFPNCAALWVLHGAVTLASECEDESVPRTAEQSFQRALQLDPNCAATHRELAILYDGILEDWAKAELHTRRADELSGQNIA